MSERESNPVSSSESTLNKGMDDHHTDSREESDRPAVELSGRASVRFFWLNSAALLLTLLFLLPIVSGPTIIHPDEAVYSAQARNIAAGSWSSPRPVPRLDPEGIHEPLMSGVVGRSRVIPYSRHITFPLLLTPGWLIAGRTGMVITSLIGLWGAAVTSGFIARMISAKLGLWSLWLVGLGSPLIFYGYTVIGHPVVAALFGLAFLGTSRSLDEGRYRHLSYALPAAAMAVLVRSEAVVVVGVLGATVCLMAFGLPKVRRANWSAVLIGTLLGATAIAAYLFDNQLVRLVTGTSSTRSNPTKMVLGEDSGPLSAAWSSLLRPWHGTGTDAVAWPLLCALALLLGAIIWRVLPKRPLLSTSLIALSAASALALALSSPRLVTGLFIAAPLLIPGLVLLHRDDLRKVLVQRALLCSAGSVALLILSVYSVGGASEWGGRFFQILLPALVPIALLGWTNMTDHVEATHRRFLISCLIITSLALSTSALRINIKLGEGYAQLRSTVLSTARRLDGAESRPLILVGINDATSRYFWNDLDKVDVLAAGYPPNLLYLIQEAAATRSHVIVVSRSRPEMFKIAFDKGLRKIGWGVIEPPLAANIAYIYVLGPNGS